MAFQQERGSSIELPYSCSMVLPTLPCTAAACTKMTTWTCCLSQGHANDRKALIHDLMLNIHFHGTTTAVMSNAYYQTWVVASVRFCFSTSSWSLSSLVPLWTQSVEFKNSIEQMTLFSWRSQASRRWPRAKTTAVRWWRSNTVRIFTAFQENAMGWKVWRLL